MGLKIGGMSAGRDLEFSRYDKMAEVFGAHGEFVEKPQDMRPRWNAPKRRASRRWST